MIFQLTPLQTLNSNDSVVPGNFTSSPKESGLTHTAVAVLLFVVFRVKCLHTVVHTGHVEFTSAMLLLYYQLTHADCPKLPWGAFTVKRILQNGIRTVVCSICAKKKLYQHQTQYWITLVPSLLAGTKHWPLKWRLLGRQLKQKLFPCGRNPYLSNWKLK